MDGGLVEAVLAKMGLERSAIAPDAAGLATVYGTWCRRVPFDNVVKRIHLASGDPGPIPNGDPDYFFTSWLEHGTGGTCWPSTLALHALLQALGFDARLGSASMRDDLSPDVHSHGTIIVTTHDADTDTSERLWWIDTSMLTDDPVPLVRGEHTELKHPVRSVRVEPVGDRWRVHWWSMGQGELPCLLLDDDATAEHCRDRYEWSRQLSPFNLFLYATRNHPDRVDAFARGNLITRDADGDRIEPVDDAARQALLQSTFGFSAEILGRLPTDVIPEPARPPA